MTSGRWIYVDGEYAPVEARLISPLDRGFALGDGVFETLLVENRRVFRLGAHLRRLRAALRRLGITPPGAADAAMAGRDARHYVWPTLAQSALEEIIDELLVRNSLTRASVRITVSRGVPESRGVLPGKMLAGPTIAVQAMPLVDYPPEKYARGFRAIVSTIRRNEYSPTAYLKSCNYLDNILARVQAAAAGADEGLLLNTAGKVACGSVANVFVVKDRHLCTPPISTGILDGITRQTVMEIASGEGNTVVEVDLDVGDLSAGEEIFLTNTLMGVMPVTVVDGQPIGGGRPGPMARRLQERYGAMVQRETSGEG